MAGPLPDTGPEDRPAAGAVAVLAWLAQASARRGDADLGAEHIAALLEDLAVRPDLATQVGLLRPDPGERSWSCLHRDAHVDVYLIAWTGGADTGWHDHDSSSGAVRVLEGAVVEERLGWAPDPPRRLVPAGEGLSFGADHVHRLTVSGDRALTLHGYSPPLRRMGQYSFDAFGALLRRAITPEESLRPVMAR